MCPWSPWPLPARGQVPGRRRSRCSASVEAINPDLHRAMGNLAHAIYTVVGERGADLDFYSVVLTDDSGTELLTLRVDIKNGISRSHQHPRLSPLWLTPPPDVLKWWSETYGRHPEGPNR